MRKFIVSIVAILIFASCVITGFAENDKYVISFNTNGIQEIQDQQYSVNDKITLPSGEAENYMFIGWYADSNFEKLFTTEQMPAQNITVYGLYAVPLSKLAYEFKDVNINEKIAQAGITPEDFNELAQSYGFAITYSINGKQYVVKDIAHYMDEIAGQANKDIDKGSTTGMSVTIKLGQDDVGRAYTFNIYNDIVKGISSVSTTKGTETSTTKDISAKEDEVPEKKQPGKIVVPIFCVVFVGLAIVTIILKDKNKKY